MNTTGREAVPGDRFHFMDNLRTTMIFLVVLYHAGAVYESSGFFATFWLVDDPSTSDVPGIVNLVIDIFVIPVLFFVSGYFAPYSVKKRQGVGFLVHRFRRIMVPWLIAVLTLIPLYKVIFLYSRQLPQEHWSTYFHFSNGIISQSWLWFLPVLFYFDVLFWLLSRMRIHVPEIRLGPAVGATFLIGTLYSYWISIQGASGWTKTILIDFQNEKLLVYFLVFLLGALCFRLRIFDRPPAGRKLYIAICCTVWIPMNVYAIVLLNLLFQPGSFIVSPTVDLLLLWGAFQVSMLSMVYVLVGTFRRYVNRAGRIAGVLNANSYDVYILHLVVIGGIALLLLGTALPALGKYIVLTVTSYTACNLLVWLYRGWRARVEG